MVLIYNITLPHHHQYVQYPPPLSLLLVSLFFFSLLLYLSHLNIVTQGQRLGISTFELEKLSQSEFNEGSTIL